MKHLVLTTIAAVLLAGCVVLMWCWPSMDIYTAAGTGNIGAVKKHLDAGVDVNAKDWLTDGTPLHSAAVFGNNKIAQLLIDNGAHVNEKDAYGCTPLHIAAAKEHKDIAELLIEKGADVNAKRDDGRTPLHYAAFHGYKETCQMLINKGADMNAKIVSGEGKGQTPLDLAVNKKQYEIVFLLHKINVKKTEELKVGGK